MKRIHTPLAVLFMAVALQQSYSAQSPARVEGVVLEAGTSQPLAGVRVGLSSRGITPTAFPPPDARVPSTLGITDSQGRFAIEAKEFGRFRVVPTLDGFVFSRPGQVRTPAEPGVWVQISPGERIQNIELRMARPAVITGRVLDAEGRPIVDKAGSVTLQRYSYDAAGKRYLNWVPGISYPGSAGSFVRMNDLGEYRFYDLPPGEYYLSVSGGGGAIGTARTFYYPGVLDEAKAIPIRLIGGEEIHLNPITLPPRQKGVDIRFHVAGPNGMGSQRRVYIAGSMLIMTTAPREDEIAISNVAPGRYDILATNSGGSSRDLLYGRVTVDVGNVDVDQEIVVKPGARVTGRLQIENGAGQRSSPSGVRCRIRSRFGLGDCLKSQVVHGIHELELEGLPADAYVLSAKASGRDIPTEGIDIAGDTELEIVLGSPGGVIQGTVRDAGGNTLPDAVVAAVPDAPFRSFGTHYRAVISDPNGRFELHGIAPGSYQLFAWTDLEGAAYRNADFMKSFDDRGRAVRVDKAARLSVDLVAFSSEEEKK